MLETESDSPPVNVQPLLNAFARKRVRYVNRDDYLLGHMVWHVLRATEWTNRNLHTGLIN